MLRLVLWNIPLGILWIPVHAPPYNMVCMVMTSNNELQLIPVTVLNSFL